MLKQDLENIANGYNAKHAISTRASSMKSHSEAGNHQRAAEYATEIEILQEAELKAQGYAPRKAPEGCEIWRLSNERWSNFLVNGGYKVSPEFYIPFDATPEQALAQARRCYRYENRQGTLVEAQDIAPLFDSTTYAIAAE